jgi:hypothetical protein
MTATARVGLSKKPLASQRMHGPLGKLFERVGRCQETDGCIGQSEKAANEAFRGLFEAERQPWRDQCTNWPCIAVTQTLHKLGIRILMELTIETSYLRNSSLRIPTKTTLTLQFKDGYLEGAVFLELV